MTDEHTMKLTDFDYLIGDHHLQMMKAALPYVNVPQQRMLSFLVKFRELQKTVSLFQEEQVAAMGICTPEETKKGSPLDMMKAIKPYGNPQEQDFIDMICNFIQGIHMAGQHQEPGPQKPAFDNAASIPPPMSSSIPSGTVSNGTIPFDSSPLEQLKGFLPPEQQARFDQAAFLIQTLQHIS